MNPVIIIAIIISIVISIVFAVFFTSSMEQQSVVEEKSDGVAWQLLQKTYLEQECREQYIGQAEELQDCYDRIEEEQMLHPPGEAECSIQCLVHDPVCGMDGVTYGCGVEDAACHGVEVEYEGECSVSPELDVTSKDCLGEAQCITGVVSEIVDGDTIKVDGQAIRFALSSAPELKGYGGVDSRNFIETLCPVGSSVVIDEDDGQILGSYGRIIGKITCNDVVLNSELLDANLGHLELRFCDSSEFRNEVWAQKHGCES